MKTGYLPILMLAFLSSCNWGLPDLNAPDETGMRTENPPKPSAPDVSESKPTVAEPSPVIEPESIVEAEPVIETEPALPKPDIKPVPVPDNESVDSSEPVDEPNDPVDPVYPDEPVVPISEKDADYSRFHVSDEIRDRLTSAKNNLLPRPGLVDIIKERISPTPTESSCLDDLSSLVTAGQIVWSQDFESLDEKGRLAHWTEPAPRAPGNPLPAFDIDRSQFHEGRQSLRISGSAAHGSIAPLNLNYVEAGREYVLSFWVKGENVANTSGHMAIIQYTYRYDAGWSNAASQYWFSQIPTGTYGWQQVVTRFTMPADQAALGSTIMFSDGGGTVWLDDIQMMAADEWEHPRGPHVTISSSQSPELERHYFTPEENISVTADGVTGPLKARLLSCGHEIQNADSRGTGDRVKLMTIDASSLAYGDYLLEISGSAVQKHMIGIRPKPMNHALVSMGIESELSTEQARHILDRLKNAGLNPLFFGGLPSRTAADQALARNLSFTMRYVPEFLLASREGALGESFPAPYEHGLSEPDEWKKAGQSFQLVTAQASLFPAFYPLILTSDDFSARSGWDWSEKNRERFEEKTGLETPLPAEFQNSHPPYHDVNRIAQPTGPVTEDNAWLSFTRFLSEDVLGGYNRKIMAGARDANPEVRVGPIPGGMGWPLFSLSSGQYPPMNFGDQGFNLLSYYMYLNYWEPEVAYVFWSEVARMGNRDLPLSIMPDAQRPDAPYHRNNFFLMMAGGAQNLAYFLEAGSDHASEEFWKEARLTIAPFAQKFGMLQQNLKAAPKKVGLLLPFTQAAFNKTYPVDLVCAYSNLLLAQTDVEPVSEEEILEGRLDDYEAVILAGVNHLSDAAYKKLSEPGLDVYMDSLTNVGLSGPHIHKMDFDLLGPGCGEGSTFYGDPAVVTKIRSSYGRDLMADWDLPADAVVRSFTGGRGQYWWIVNVDTGPEYFEKTAGNDAAPRPMTPGVFSVPVSLPGNQGVYYDVLKGRALGTTLEMPRFGGTLIARYPEAPRALDIDWPSTIESNAPSSTLNVSVNGSSGPIAALFPLHIDIKDPQGNPFMASEYSVTKDDGHFSLPLFFGKNAARGKWSLQITELSTGLKQTLPFIVR